MRLERCWLLLVLAVVLWRVSAGSAYRNGPEIRSDGVGYHAWTHAILTSDYRFCGWGAEAPGFVSYQDPARGICQNKYPPGLSLFRFPVMAFLVDRGPVPTISEDEHLASAIISAVVLWTITALSLWTLAMLGVRPGRATGLVAVTLFATGLFHYGTYDGGFTHVYSALFCGLLCAFAVRERMQDKPMPLALVFVCSFFLLSIRTTNGLLWLSLCAAYLIWHRRRLLSQHVMLRSVAAGLGASLALALQLAYNYYVHRAWQLSTYGSETFVFDRPMQDAVLFSYERGVLTYQPIYGFALLCGFAVAASRGWSLLLLVTMGAYVLLYGYWHSWMLGGGMGHRGFIELAPIVAIALGLAWRNWNTPKLVLGTIASSLCAAVTMTIMIGYWNGTYPFGGADKHLYWTHVLGYDPDAAPAPAPPPPPPKRKKKRAAPAAPHG